MADIIAQRELRNDNARIMRRVEAGESFVITRNGKPIADLVPHRDPAQRVRRKTLGEVQRERRRNGPRVDLAWWLADREKDNLILGDDRVEY